MSRRSVYRGAYCLYCHKPIKEGRAALASTYYVINDIRRPMVHTQSRLRYLTNWQDTIKELELRVVYHRACIERILSHAPLEPEVDTMHFEDYRAALLARFGLNEQGEQRVPEPWEWTPTECPHCHGTGLAPSSDSETPCGFCEDGALTVELRKELHEAWGHIISRAAKEMS
jgi:hypothetical protein